MAGIAAETSVEKLDAQGRLSLGSKFRHALVVVVHRKDGSMLIEPAEAIPQRELWVHRGAVGKSMALALGQAAGGELTDGPDVEADLADFEGDE